MTIARHAASAHIAARYARLGVRHAARYARHIEDHMARPAIDHIRHAAPRRRSCQRKERCPMSMHTQHMLRDYIWFR